MSSTHKMVATPLLSVTVTVPNRKRHRTTPTAKSKIDIFDFLTKTLKKATGCVSPPQTDIINRSYSLRGKSNHLKIRIRRPEGTKRENEPPN
ncbi:hypothetical protein TNCV_3352811 [Trichonephila clavipes]|nr:hypothetical protein TNCV_3352811 [Trichonephila clavipes]